MRYLITLLFVALSFNAIGQIQYDFPYNPDADNDAFVSSTDLLELLAIYGQEFSSDELYLSQDSTSLIVYVGDLNRVKCGAACFNLEGNWSNLNEKDLMRHYDQLEIDPPLPYGNYDYIYMWYAQAESSANFISDPRPWQMQRRSRNQTTSSNGIVAPAFLQTGGSPNDDDLSECWCVTHQRPTVEYMHIQNLTEEEVNVLSSQGWVHTNSNFGSNSDSEYTGTMWRWAE